MKNIGIFIVALFLFSSCKPSVKDKTEPIPDEVQTKSYPEDLAKVFENHGSLEKWNIMRSMSYEIVNEEGNEKQMIDLQTRAERIEAVDFKQGFDGEKYWVEADTSYKGRPKFYTNLMFYFYAMPFVLADDGIIYDKTDPLIFEEKSYPGFRISYDDGVGISPEDEYFVHYDPETYEMQWLGYTVTYYSGKKSDKIKYIRYNDWNEFNGLKLPNSISWYKTEEGKVTELRNTKSFTNVLVSKDAFPKGALEMPEGAREVE